MRQRVEKLSREMKEAAERRQNSTQNNAGSEAVRQKETAAP
jgi:hypothetical protein